MSFVTRQRATLTDRTRRRFFLLSTKATAVAPEDANSDYVTFETLPSLGPLSSKETDIEIQRLLRQATSLAPGLKSLAGWPARRDYRAPPPFRFRPRPGAKFPRHCDPL